MNEESEEEVWEYRLDSFHHCREEFGKTLAKALCYLPTQDVIDVMDAAFFVPWEGRSVWFSQEFVRGRGIILIAPDDLKDEQMAIVTILHEAAHAFLKHGRDIPADSRQNEREADFRQVLKRWTTSTDNTRLATAAKNILKRR